MVDTTVPPCPVCGSTKVFLCSGGYYICNQCEWYAKKEE